MKPHADDAPAAPPASARHPRVRRTLLPDDGGGLVPPPVGAELRAAVDRDDDPGAADALERQNRWLAERLAASHAALLTLVETRDLLQLPAALVHAREVLRANVRPPRGG